MIQKIEYVGPVEIVAEIVADNGWEVSDNSSEEVAFFYEGLQFNFHWLQNENALHMACAFDLKVPEDRKLAVSRLALSINEHLWVGHFDVWFNDDIVMYRHAHILPEGVDLP